MNLNDLSHSGIIGGAGVAALLTGIAAGWSRIKSFGSYLASALVLQRTIPKRYLANVVGSYIRHNYRMMPSGSSFVYETSAIIDDQPMYSDVPFEMPSTSGIWRGPRGTFFINITGHGLKLLSIRGLSDPNGLISDALAANEESRAANYERDAETGYNFRVIPVMGSIGESMSDFIGRDKESPQQPAAVGSQSQRSSDDVDWWFTPELAHDESFMYEKSRYLRESKKHDPLRGLFYPESVLNMLDQMKQWYRRRDWYAAHGIPWRTGVLLYGPGGTGKSSLAKVTAQTLGIPLYQYYLNTLNDRDFVNKWGEMATPCVVALEDFDTVFHGRESTTVHKSLSFECVLNQISGISAVNGVLLLVTTNHLEHIDPALGQLDANKRPTRPGRIDHILHMGNTTEKQRRDIAHYTLCDTAPDMVDSMVREQVETTAAQFQSLCIQVALERLHDQRSPKPNNVVPLLDRHGLPVHPESDEYARSAGLH